MSYVEHNMFRQTMHKNKMSDVEHNMFRHTMHKNKMSNIAQNLLRHINIQNKCCTVVHNLIRYENYKPNQPCTLFVTLQKLQEQKCVTLRNPRKKQNRYPYYKNT